MKLKGLKTMGKNEIGDIAVEIVPEPECYQDFYIYIKDLPSKFETLYDLFYDAIFRCISNNNEYMQKVKQNTTINLILKGAWLEVTTIIPYFSYYGNDEGYDQAIYWDEEIEVVTPVKAKD